MSHPNTELAKKKLDGTLPDEVIAELEQVVKYFKSPMSIQKFFADDKIYNVINVGKDEDLDCDTVRRFACTAYKSALGSYKPAIDIVLNEAVFEMNEKDLVASALEGVMLADYRYDMYKSEKSEFNVSDINFVYGKEVDFDGILNKIGIIRDAVFMTRDMINGPANEITISYFDKKARQLAKDNNLYINVFDKKSLEENNMNLILAVGAAGHIAPELIELSYLPDPKYKTVNLVGKGVVFDAGGLNIKPGNYMDDMKSDMSGAATVMALVTAAAQLKLPVNVRAFMPLVENGVDANSYRTGDIIKAYNGKTVEIKNTDAEGRLILADALSYSDRYNADLTIDMATLTGAAVVALGTGMTAGFFTNEDTREELMLAADLCNEPIWELPLFKDYDEGLKSDVADLSNIGPAREAGTITAALFLKNFVKNENWVHLDIAGTAFMDKAHFYNPKGAVGVMIRTLIKYLEKYNES